MARDPCRITCSSSSSFTSPPGEDTCLRAVRLIAALPEAGRTMLPSLNALFRLYLLLLLLSQPITGSVIHKRQDRTHPIYLSSSTRSDPPKSFGLFSFSRHPATLGTYDPLLGVRDVILHQGLAEGLGRSSSAMGVMEVAQDIRNQGIQGDTGEMDRSNRTESLVWDPVQGRLYSDRVLWMHDGHRQNQQVLQTAVRRQEEEAGEAETDNEGESEEEAEGPIDTTADDAETLSAEAASESSAEEPQPTGPAEGEGEAGGESEVSTDAWTSEDVPDDDDEWEWVDEDAPDPPEEPCDPSLPPTLAAAPGVSASPAPSAVVPTGLYMVAKRTYELEQMDALEKRRKNKGYKEDDDEEDDGDYHRGAGGRGRYDEDDRDRPGGNDLHGSSSSTSPYRGSDRWSEDDKDERESGDVQGSRVGGASHTGGKKSDDSNGDPSYSSQSQSSRSTLTDDCKNLRQFYDAMSGDSWTNKAGWSDSKSTDCCDWFGVTCGIPAGDPSDLHDKRGWKGDQEEDGYTGRRGSKHGNKWDDDDEGDDEEDSGWKSGQRSGKWDENGSRDSSAHAQGHGSDGRDDDWKPSKGMSSDDGSERVIALNLINNGLTGLLSDHLFSLDALARMSV